ncbi:MAG: hypothetical protein RL701_5264 [Pseudomonadota bacterium]|jgi:hypothetical protein
MDTDTAPATALIATPSTLHSPTAGSRRSLWHRPWPQALALYAGLSLLLTWPLGARLFSHIPLGTLPEATVPYFNLWTLSWNAERLAHGYHGYWDAPIFYPVHDAFALSEPQGLTGLLFAPLSAALGPVAGYNLTLLCLLCLNAAAGRRWLRVLGVSELSATLGGALLLGLPFVQRELGVLQLCAVWPVVFGLSELARLASAPDPRALLRLGVWTVAIAWSCIYHVLFFGWLVLIGLFVLTRVELVSRRMLVAGVVATLVVCAGIWPLMAAEERAVSQYTRSQDTIRAGSASLLSYAQFPQQTPLARLLPGWARSGQRRALYPGIGLCVLAALGWKHSRRYGLQRWRRYALLFGALALWVSLGTRLQLGGLRPYVWFERHALGFSQLRSPYRAGLFVHLGLLCFAGFGLDRVAGLAKRVRSPLARYAPIVCAALALFELTPLEFALQRFPHEVLQEPWIAWLAQQPEGAVAMVPPNASGRTRDYVDTTLAMMQATLHGHPLVNGYSGFFPPGPAHVTASTRRFPSPASLRALRDAHVRYAVVDKQWPQASQLLDEPAAGVRRVFSTTRRIVYRIDPVSAAPVSM